MEFENKVNMVGKNETGVELSNSPNHDNVVMVRTIEMNKEAIRKDPVVLFPVIDLKTVEHIYREYCATALHNGIENLNMSYIRQAIDLCFLYQLVGTSLGFNSPISYLAVVLSAISKDKVFNYARYNNK